MSLYEDNNLPGVFTEVVTQYGEDYDMSQFGTGDSICVIGTAFDGPVGKQVKIYSPAHGRYIFGAAFNAKTRKEATLTAGIQDAWDRGCRTIYAVRIGGKEIFKDFQLSTDSNFKLRVSGLFPSNANKQLAVCLERGNEVDGEGSLKIFKKADRATVKEKKFGLVENQSQVLENEISFDMNGLTNNDELIDLIKLVNSQSFNNVIKLSIVDHEGNDVTLSSKEAKTLKVSDMFSGVYLIGRGANITNKIDTEMILGINEEGGLVKKLIKNTNITKDYPLFSAKGDLDKLLDTPSLEEYGFLTVPGKLDELFTVDEIDYEEVDASLFDTYEKLGSGYAINAELKRDAKGGRPKVVEVTDKDKRISAITGGTFSMLENFKVDYRVMLGLNADDKIKGRLPKINDFIVSKPNDIILKDGVIELTPVVNQDDFTAPKVYEVSVEGICEEELGGYLIEPSAVKLDKVIREVSLIDKDAFNKLNSESKFEKVSVKEGSLFLLSEAVTNKDGVLSPVPDNNEIRLELFIYTKGQLQSLHEEQEVGEEPNLNSIYGEVVFSEGKFFCASQAVPRAGVQIVKFKEATMAEVVGEDVAMAHVAVAMDNDIFTVVKATDPTEGGALLEEAGVVIYPAIGTVIGTCDQIFKAEQDLLVTAIETAYSNEIIKDIASPILKKNRIRIRTNQQDYITVEEFAQILEADKDFSKLFTVKIVNDTKAQEYVEDMMGGDNVNCLVIPAQLDREVGYDYSKLIRFRTTDNFARLLAQHCAYASLKTAPTHGFIGVTPLLNTSLESVDKKVEALMEMQIESTLVAKKPNGQNMLNKDSVPHHIGRNISVTVCQYPIVTANNYTFISNLAAGYAGMVSKLPIDQSSTCQPITIPVPTITFNQYQLKNLTNAGFVTVKESQLQGMVVTDGVTMAPAENVFRRLSCCRIANAIDDILRNECEPFIGKQNSPANQNALRTAIKSGLDAVKDRLIEGYEFRMNIDSSTKQLGKIEIYYKIVPIYEIKEIKNHITI